MSHKNNPITRRTLLRGAGAMLALPVLDVMKPITSIASAALAPTASPLRMAYFFVPNGVNMDHWRPKSPGSLAELPSILSPLAKHKDSLLVLSGLSQNNARALGDGPGDHARALSCFLTGVHAKKTDGADIRVGVSVDQLAAQRIGRATRFPSLELGVERGAQSGNCDSGYSCAYSSNMSWSSPTTPVAKEINPRAVFERMFGDSENTPEKKKRDKFRQSVLDYVTDDAKRLKNRLGVADQRKLDEYLTSVREIEQRIQRSGVAAKPPRDFRVPVERPENTTEHIRLMGDLMVLAFQTDQTRIATFMMANAGSNRNYPMIGVNDGHHELSHHGRNSDKLEKIRKIDTFHIEQFAYILDRLQSIKEGEKTLLDQCMIVYGSGIGDGDRHNHNDLPVLLAGKAGGAIKAGRHIQYQDDHPLNNLYVWMLDKVGVQIPSFGDSTGKLVGLEG